MLILIAKIAVMLVIATVLVGVVLFVSWVFFFKKFVVFPGSSFKTLISESVTNIREKGFRKELELWIMSVKQYGLVCGALSGMTGEKPSVLEVMVGVRENGLEAELEFLKSLKGKDPYAQIVSLAFRYERRHLIYN